MNVTLTSAVRGWSEGANFQLLTADATESTKIALPPRFSTSLTVPSVLIVTETRTVPLTFIFFRMSGYAGTTFFRSLGWVSCGTAAVVRKVSPSARHNAARACVERFDEVILVFSLREEVRGSPLRIPAILLRWHVSSFRRAIAVGQRQRAVAVANGVFRGGSHDGADLWYRSATKKIHHRV